MVLPRALSFCSLASLASPADGQRLRAAPAQVGRGDGTRTLLGESAFARGGETAFSPERKDD